MTEPEPLGTIMRTMREDDSLILEQDGRRIATIFIARVPHDLKVRVGVTAPRSIRISHGEQEQSR